MRRIATRNGRLGLTCAVTLSALAFYALSIGPACRLSRHGMLPVRSVATVYRPLLWLDFHMPAALQSVLTHYADFCGGREKLDAARDEPVWCQYDISGFTCRYRSRVRRPLMRDEPNLSRIVINEPDVPLLMTEEITSSIEPDTWDEVGGRGQCIPEESSSTLRISQSRRAHAAIAQFIHELREIHRDTLRDHDLDLISLMRIQGKAGAGLLWELKAHALIIDRRRDGRWEFDGEPVGDIEVLFKRLDAQTAEELKMGIFVPLYDDYLPGSDHDRLVSFCRTKNVDLFVFDRECYDRDLIGWRPGAVLWEVRRSDSIYAVRGNSATR